MLCMTTLSSFRTGLAVATLLSFASVAEARLENAQGPVQVSGAALVLVFSGPVDLRASFVVLLDDRGHRVETGKLHLSGNDSDLEIPLESALRPGAYTLSWQAVSGYGKISVGKYTFTIDPPVFHAPSVAQE
jgi:methionine-rich copper-binding protein CopC